MLWDAGALRVGGGVGVTFSIESLPRLSAATSFAMNLAAIEGSSAPLELEAHAAPEFERQRPLRNQSSSE